MNTRKNGSWLSAAVLILGSAALLLRRQLYLTGVDGKGLLLRGTLLETGLLLLTAAVPVLLVLTVEKTAGSPRFEDNYSAGIPAALGHGAMALGVLSSLLTAGSLPAGYLGAAWRWLGIATPFCLLLAGGSRLFRKKPFFLLHVVPCLFLLVHIVSNYQTWSSLPQLQDYLFGLLGSLALALFSYYTAAFEADCGNRRMVRLTGLAAVYLCLAELGRTHQPLLYLGGAVWALTGMCRPAQKD